MFKNCRVRFLNGGKYSCLAGFWDVRVGLALFVWLFVAAAMAQLSAAEIATELDPNAAVDKAVDIDTSGKSVDAYSHLSLADILNLEVTIASKTEETRAASPSVVTVLTRTDIRRMGVQTLEELLNYVPGYQITPETTQGMHSRYAVRGRSSSLSEHVLLLIDGQRINDNLYGSPSVLKNCIAVENIERVEVIRGPGSALYGSNAFLGVINVITDQKDSFIWAQGGNNKLISGSARWSQDLGKLHVSGFGRVYSDEGGEFPTVVDRFGNSGTGRDPYDAGDFSLLAQYGNSKLHLKHMAREFQGYLIWDIVQDRTGSNNTHFSSARFDQKLQPNENSNLSFFSEYSFARWSSSGVTMPAGIQLGPGLTIPTAFRSGPNMKEHQFAVGSELDWQIYEKNRLVVGGTYGFASVLACDSYLNYLPSTWEYLGDVVLFDNRDHPELRWNSYKYRHIGGLYLQDKQTIGDFLFITAGVRADIYSDFGYTVNPRTALVLETPINSNFKAMYGRAFRAPTHSQLYNRANPVDKGNPDLDAEQVNTFEVAYVQKIKEQVEATISYSYYDISEAIVPGTVPPVEDNPFGVLSWENTGNFNAKSLEFEMRAEPVSWFNILASYAFVHDMNFDMLVAEHSASLALNFYYGGFNANFSGIGRNELTSPGIDDQGIYYVINGRLEYSFTKNISLYVNGRNITDFRYRTIAQNITGGLPNRGRYIISGLIINL